MFGGRLSLDLTWTVRYRALWPTELLATPHELHRWLLAAGLPAPATVTPRQLHDARTLREAIHRAVDDVLAQRGIGPTELAAINGCAARPTPHPVLTGDATSLLVTASGTEASAALAMIARDAIDLLATGDGRLRRCEGPLCSLVFHDSSRPGTRRWCSAAGCGNKVNTKAYRERLRLR